MSKETVRVLVTVETLPSPNDIDYPESKKIYMAIEQDRFYYSELAQLADAIYRAMTDEEAVV